MITKASSETEKNGFKYVAIIYDCMAVKPNSNLVAATNRRPSAIMRPLLNIGLPPESKENPTDGLSKESLVLRLKLGSNLEVERELWEVAKNLPAIAPFIESGQLQVIEPNNDGDPSFARYSAADAKVLIHNILAESDLDAYLKGETRKEVFKVCEEQRATIKAMRDAQVT